MITQSQPTFPFMATDWRWCWTPKRLKVHLPTFTTGFVLPSIKIVCYQHLLVSFEELLSLRLSDHFALVVGCINSNWLNLCNSGPHSSGLYIFRERRCAGNVRVSVWVCQNPLNFFSSPSGIASHTRPDGWHQCYCHGFELTSLFQSPQIGVLQGRSWSGAKGGLWKIFGK